MRSVQNKPHKKPAQKRQSTHVSNQVKLDANNPIPFENGSKTFSFVHGVSYLPFLPPSDDYARTLLEARLLSDTNNACITTKKDYCAGRGMQDNEGDKLEQPILDWFASMNKKNESITKLNKKIFEDFFTFGNVPIELVRFTVLGKKQLFIYVHNFLEWRLCKPNDEDIVTHAIHSRLFLRDGYINSEDLKKSKKLPIYNPRNTEKENWYKDEKGVERTLIWYKNSISGFPNYGLPSNVASLIYQILEYKGARFDLDNFENNLVVGGMVLLKGNLGQAEANRIGREIINTHSGDGKRGRWAVVASEEGIDDSSVHNYDTAKDGSYMEADAKWTQKIILANQWDAILAGLVSASTLGKGEGFLNKIIEHKERTVIKPAQDDLISEVWSHIFKIAESWLGLTFSKYTMTIKSFVEISSLSDVDITPAVTVDEVREAKGLTKVGGEKGRMFLGEIKGKQQKQKEGDDVPD